MILCPFKFQSLYSMYRSVPFCSNGSHEVFNISDCLSCLRNLHKSPCSSACYWSGYLLTRNIWCHFQNSPGNKFPIVWVFLYKCKFCFPLNSSLTTFIKYGVLASYLRYTSLPMVKLEFCNLILTQSLHL